MFRVHRHYLRALFPRAAHDHGPGADKRLLVGERYAFALVYRRERGTQAHRAGNRRHNAVRVRAGGRLYEPRLARRADGDARTLQLGAQTLVRVRVEGRDVAGAQELSLLNEQADILVSSQGRDADAEPLADLYALPAYAAGGAEDGCASDHLYHLRAGVETAKAYTRARRRARCRTCRARRRGPGRSRRSPLCRTRAL